MDTATLQRALTAAGFPVDVDGVFGRETIGAVAAFQKARGLDVRWPGTVGPKTIAALLGVSRVPGMAYIEVPVADTPPPWFELCGQKMGLHEVRDNAKLRKFLKSDGDGKSLGDPAKLPWCGELVQVCIAITLRDELLPNNPYLARNWLKFGVGLDEPAIGAVLVFWRGKRVGTAGHVGFCAGVSDIHSSAPPAYLVRGGNQANSISEAWLDKDRLLPGGIRWPLTWPRPMGGVAEAAGGGALSTDEA